jgi:hypothetical protein
VKGLCLGINVAIDINSIVIDCIVIKARLLDPVARLGKWPTFTKVIRAVFLLLPYVFYSSKC